MPVDHTSTAVTTTGTIDRPVTLIRGTSGGDSLQIKLMVGICLLTFLAVSALVIWGSDRGFDMQDEGLQLIVYDQPHRLYNMYSYWNNLLVAAFGFSSGGAVSYLRATNFFSVIVSSITLWFGAVSWAKRYRQFAGLNSALFRLTLLFFTLSGNFLSYAMLQQAFGYNGETVLLSSIASGLLFLALAHVQQHRALSSVLAAAAGCFATLTAAAKVTSGVCLLAAASVLVLTTEWRLLLPFIAGGLAGGIAIVEFVVSPRQILADCCYLACGGTVSDTHHGPGLLLSLYLQDLMQNATRAMIVSLPIFFIFFKDRFSRRIFIPLLIAASCAAFGYAVASSYFVKINVFFALGAWLLLFSLHQDWNRRKDIPLCTGVLFLGALPFIAACGSNNPLCWEAAALCLGPWLLMIFLLSMKVCDRHSPWLNTQTIVIACATLLFLQFIYGYLFHPHRVWTTMFEQNRELQTSNLAGLKVSPDVDEEVVQVEKLLDANGYRRGDPILALYDRPGLVYALGGQSIGIPWYYRLSPHNNETTVAEYLPKGSKRFFLVLEDATLTPGMLAAFNKAGASYPDAFRYLGTVPKSGQKDYGNNLYVFAHKLGNQKR